MDWNPVERSINDIIPIDKALNESMLNPGILTNEVNNYISKSDEVVSNNENDEVANNNDNDEVASNNGNDGVASNDGSDRIDETNSTNIDGDTDGNDNGISTIQEVKDGDKHIRKSERIRKQRYEIHPDDIGNNDYEKDENYKR